MVGREYAQEVGNEKVKKKKKKKNLKRTIYKSKRG